jgi:transposase
MSVITFDKGLKPPLSYCHGMKNKYFTRSRISERKFREIIRYFALDIEANKIAKLTGINRNSINKIIKAVRQRVAEYCETESPFETGEVEMDESYFGARRVRVAEAGNSHYPA